ncbi:cytochrome P450 [Aquibium sp. ELW1220]|uniref:cytochrome P450 n=1 Tax=Aquibium sp. ELW1220 TaxID=2976766 RepID=UPI0025AF7922|nr:cytochrome P450 [Aquibium sp. ELW1220]MDN2578995.1 cytochrome P450 [Aquibium sp. ELW1220]
MRITEQLIIALYAAAERQNRGEEVPEFVADHVTIGQILRNGDLFRKDYGLISEFMLSRFNTDGKGWKDRRSISQNYFGSVKATAFAHSMSKAAEEAFDPGVNFAGSGLRRHCIRYAAGNLFRMFGWDSVPDGFVEWTEQMRVFVQELQIRTLSGTAGANSIAPRKEALLDELQAILPAGFPIIAAGIERLGDERQILEELAMLLFGGVESTVSTMLWCMELLGRGAEYQGILREQDPRRRRELVVVFINEIMRRFPAVPLLVRTPAAATTIGGRWFPKDQPVMISIIGAHHDARNWENPFIFDYRRREFLDGSFRHGTFIPFSHGPRTCAGARLAADEIREAMLHLTVRFEIEQPIENLAFDYGLTLNPTTWEHIRFRPLH